MPGEQVVAGGVAKARTLRLRALGNLGHDRRANDGISRPDGLLSRSAAGIPSTSLMTITGRRHRRRSMSRLIVRAASGRSPLAVLNAIDMYESMLGVKAYLLIRSVIGRIAEQHVLTIDRWRTWRAAMRTSAAGQAADPCRKSVAVLRTAASISVARHVPDGVLNPGPCGRRSARPAAASRKFDQPLSKAGPQIVISHFDEADGNLQLIQNITRTIAFFDYNLDLAWRIHVIW